MRQLQVDRGIAPRTTVLRSLVIAVAVVAVLGASGCRLFKHKTEAYKMSAESRPLEVPPDLNLPSTSGAMELPGGQDKSVTRSTMGASSSAANGFIIPGDRDTTFDKVGVALAAIDGVTIASKAQLLGVYDVSYEGANFLVRVAKADAGSYVSAVDPRGQAATAAAPAKLITALKAALGG